MKGLTAEEREMLEGSWPDGGGDRGDEEAFRRGTARHYEVALALQTQGRLTLACESGYLVPRITAAGREALRIDALLRERGAA